MLLCLYIHNSWTWGSSIHKMPLLPQGSEFEPSDINNRKLMPRAMFSWTSCTSTTLLTYLACSQVPKAMRVHDHACTRTWIHSVAILMFACVWLLAANIHHLFFTGLMAIGIQKRIKWDVVHNKWGTLVTLKFYWGERIHLLCPAVYIYMCVKLHYTSL